MLRTYKYSIGPEKKALYQNRESQTNILWHIIRQEGIQWQIVEERWREKEAGEDQESHRQITSRVGNIGGMVEGACLYLCMCVYVCLYVCMYVCMYVCTYVYRHICVPVSM